MDAYSRKGDTKTTRMATVGRSWKTGIKGGKEVGGRKEVYKRTEKGKEEGEEKEGKKKQMEKRSSSTHVYER